MVGRTFALIGIMRNSLNGGPRKSKDSVLPTWGMREEEHRRSNTLAVSLGALVLIYFLFPNSIGLEIFRCFPRK